jgi:predicted porin
MIGGLCKSAGVASLAAAGLLMGGVTARAADLGGNCCADLEERVAELEATTVRKGNRKVSLEVSGHVNEAILFWDDGYDQAAYIVTNNYSRTRFRFKGSARINADWSAGFLIEMGARWTGDSAAASQFTTAKTELDIRHQALYVKSNTLGTVWLGHTSTAVDGIADICLGCTITSTHEAALGWGGFETRFRGDELAFGPTWGALGAGNNVASGASRRQVLRYISPTLAGFVFSADWGGSTNTWDDQTWSVALRYAGEFNSIRIAGGIGYHEEDGSVYEEGCATNPSIYCGDFVHDSFRRGWGGSLSIQHVPTGLFIAGSYGEQQDTDNTFNGLRDKTDGWSVVGGIGQRWSSLGKTTFWGRYGEYTGRSGHAGEYLFDEGFAEFVDGASTVWSLGLNQQIDAAAMELYVTYWNVSGTINDSESNAKVDPRDFNAIMTGARIKF